MARKTVSHEAARKRLDELIRQRPNASYASISALIGRNHAYIQQYIRRGQPQRLREEDRRRIAEYFDVAEWELGGPPPEANRAGFHDSVDELVFLPRFEMRLCGHPGGPFDRSQAREFIPFRQAQLSRLTATSASKLSVLSIAGDSMYPTLADGDDVLVDHGETAPRCDGIYAIRMQDALQVKRISVNPITGNLAVKSDNPLYESWSDCDRGRVDVIGRVIWVGRRL